MRVRAFRFVYLISEQSLRVRQCIEYRELTSYLIIKYTKIYVAIHIIQILFLCILSLVHPRLIKMTRIKRPCLNNRLQKKNNPLACRLAVNTHLPKTIEEYFIYTVMSIYRLHISWYITGSPTRRHFRRASRLEISQVKQNHMCLDLEVVSVTL